MGHDTRVQLHTGLDGSNAYGDAEVAESTRDRDHLHLEAIAPACALRAGTRSGKLDLHWFAWLCR